MATAHELKIMQHCLEHGIAVQTLASGAVRFTGRGVSIITHDIASVSLANLRSYTPRKPLAVRADWDLHCVEKDYPLKPWQRKVDTRAAS